MNYAAFLKLKTNEVSAVSELLDEGLEFGVFFDIPRPLSETEPGILERLRIGEKAIRKMIPDCEYFVDNFDLDDSISLGGKEQYSAILEYLSATRVHPVVGLHRGAIRNKGAVKFAIDFDRRIALRLTEADIESFALTAPSLAEVLGGFDGIPLSRVTLVVDLRVISYPWEALAKQVGVFLEEFFKKYPCREVVIAGSSIPPSIRDVLKTSSWCELTRREVQVWHGLKSYRETSAVPNWCFGDYGVVSPDYTDTELDFGIVVKTAAPKAMYSFDKGQLVVRGGAFQSHKDGYQQYYAIADVLVNKSYFRVAASGGDDYIYARSEKAKARASRAGSPGTWLKATLTSHIAYMVKVFT